MRESAVRLATFLGRTVNVDLVILLILFPPNLRADVVLERVGQLAGPSYAVAVAGGHVYAAVHDGGLVVMQLTPPGDLNRDGEVNGTDIDRFFACLGSGWCP